MTGEVRLREVRPEDLPVIFRDQADPESVRLAAVPPRDRAAFDEHWARILADDAVVARAVEAGGSFAGTVVAFERLGVRELGYWISRDRWGQGIATRAVEAFLLEHPERPLFARVAVQNPASVRVLEKCGFVPAPDGPSLDDGVEEVVLRLDYPPSEFAFPGALRDRLVAAILDGSKTTTSCLLLEYELDGAPLAVPGERSAVVDSAGVPVAVIEVVSIEVRPFRDIDDAFARDEGEGYDSHAGWAEAHRRFWESDEYRAAIGQADFIVRDDTPVVMERFRLVETLDTATGPNG